MLWSDSTCLYRNGSGELVQGTEWGGGKSRTRADPDQMGVRAGQWMERNEGDRSVLKTLIRQAADWEQLYGLAVEGIYLHTLKPTSDFICLFF